MPIDRDFITKESSLASVADAIRARGNTSSVLNYPNGFVSAIGDIGNYMVGATAAWNQLSEDSNRMTLTNYTTGSGTLAGTTANSIIGHVYLLLNVVTEFDTLEPIAYRFYYDGSSHATNTVSPNVIYKATTDSSRIYYINFASAYHNKTITKMVLSPIAVDLTVDFGSTIADYLATLESDTPGAGVAKFRELFNESYYPYDAGSLKSVQYSEWQQNSPIVLNGILNLVNNVWVRDGDIYNNGEVTRKYGTIDLGTLEWTFYTPWGFQSDTAITGIKAPATDNDYASAICSQYIVTTANAVFASTADKIFAIRANGKIVIHDAATLSMTGAQFAAAMSGVNLVYELATPYIET